MQRLPTGTFWSPCGRHDGVGGIQLIWTVDTLPLGQRCLRPHSKCYVYTKLRHSTSNNSVTRHQLLVPLYGYNYHRRTGEEWRPRPGQTVTMAIGGRTEPTDERWAKTRTRKRPLLKPSQSDCQRRSSLGWFLFSVVPFALGCWCLSLVSRVPQPVGA